MFFKSFIFAFFYIIPELLHFLKWEDFMEIGEGCKLTEHQVRQEYAGLFLSLLQGFWVQATALLLAAWSWRDQDWWVEEGQETEEVRLQSAMRSPGNSPCARGRKRHPRRRSRGGSSSTSPGWGRDTARGVPARGRLPRLQESDDDEYTPASSPLEKGKKARQRSQSVASTASLQWRKKQFPLTKKRKKETSGWMKKKKNTPQGDEGHP